MSVKLEAPRLDQLLRGSGCQLWLPLAYLDRACRGDVWGAVTAVGLVGQCWQPVTDVAILRDVLRRLAPWMCQDNRDHSTPTDRAAHWASGLNSHQRIALESTAVEWLRDAWDQLDVAYADVQRRGIANLKEQVVRIATARDVFEAVAFVLRHARTKTPDVLSTLLIFDQRAAVLARMLSGPVDDAVACITPDPWWNAFIDRKHP